MFLLFFSWTWKKNVIILWAKSCRSRDYRTALNVAILTVPGWPASLGAVMFWYGVSKPSQSSSLTAITWPPCWGSSLLHQMGSILKNSCFSVMNFQAWCCIQMEFLSTSFLSNWRSYCSPQAAFLPSLVKSLWYEVSAVSRVYCWGFFLWKMETPTIDLNIKMTSNGQNFYVIPVSVTARM